MKLPSDQTKASIEHLKEIEGGNVYISQFEKQLQHQLAEESILRDYGADLETFYNTDNTYYNELILQNAQLFQIKKETPISVKYRYFIENCITAAIEFNKCFIKLSEEQLYIGAATFGRMVGDVCNRCYGAIIVNPESLETYITRLCQFVTNENGKVLGIDNMESNGKQLTANYLARKLTERYPYYFEYLQSFNEFILLSWYTNLYNDLNNEIPSDASFVKKVDDIIYRSRLEYINNVLIDVLNEYISTYSTHN